MKKTRIDYWRQLGLFDPSKFSGNVTIVGAGSVGSFVALTLAKMGIRNIRVIDFDTVESHNLPNQFYRIDDISKPKVEALKQIITDFSGTVIDVVNKKVQKTDLSLSDFVIMAVDSMKVRKQIYKKIKSNPYVKYLIDVRTSGESFRLYAINNGDTGDLEFYEKSLYSDKEASELPCTAQNIVYTVAGVSAFVSAKVKKMLLNQPYKRLIIYDFVSGIKLS